MDKILEHAIDAAKIAGKTIMRFYKTQLNVREKSPNNPVTKADIAANDKIKDLLTSQYPKFGWLSEETKDSLDRLNKEYVWIIDPIDGTKEFIEGIPNFSISIGLVQNEIPIVGVLYNPATKELFYAQKNKGAFYNNNLVKCSKKNDIRNINIVVSRSEMNAGLWDEYSSTTKNKIEIGSVAYKLGLISAGKYDFFATLKPKNEWDICAGHIILEESGGELKNIENFKSPIYNQKNTLQKPGLVGGNLDLCKSFSTVWNKNN
jgi:myo-inositol-1(or 4)-monophosphatase|tara:strand:- start:2025 stop:2810 length:786 start_codon:yes stop_codon:yes gene_type:complete